MRSADAFQPTRRSFLTSAAMWAVARRCLPAATSAALVRTSLGVLRGEVSSSASVRVFRGIPFAEPPVDSLRFRAPQPPRPWAGERDATRFGASPMQPGEPGVEHSEDALTLNLWAPTGAGPFPVFVWVHGGGFTSGHSFEAMYDGTGFAQAGIICISVAYRLGVFGFLDLEPLLGASYAGSANNGLRDLIAALTWIQLHVADFGGDPGRVTLGGESAGAKLAGLLMGVPSARSLFHQVISESGGAERIWSRSDSAAVSTGFGRRWSQHTGQESRALATAPAALIIQAQGAFLKDWPQHFPLRAEIDGTLLPRLPIETVRAGGTRGLRLLIGTNRDESALFVGPHPSLDATAADLGNLSVARFAQVYLRYAALYPQMSDEQRRIRALTAEEYWVPSVRLADAHSQSGASVWMYRLDFAESSGRLRGYAYHSLDVGMVWGRPHPSVGNAKDEADISERMHRAWAAFIRGDTPAAPGLPVWPRYQALERATMAIDTPSHVELAPQQAELDLWQGML